MSATIVPPLAERTARRDAPVDHAALAPEVHQSIRNALKLGLSLVGTWAVALVVRIYLPRQLGPASFGVFQFADAFTATLFVFLNVGLETYIRKEVATRPAHAAEFFGGTLLIRLGLSVIVIAAALGIVAWSGKPTTVLIVVLILSAFQIVFCINATFAAMLQATATVGGLSLLNVATKLLWGVGIVGALKLGAGVAGVGVAMVAAELVRLVGLMVLTRRHLSLRFEVDLSASWTVLRASLPFYALVVAQTVYGRIDMSVMSFLTTDTEVGWYGASATVAAIAFLLSPLIQWVVTPLSSRAVAQSSDALMHVARRGLEIVLVIAIPSSLALGLGAHVIVGAAFGAAYFPAVRSLQLLAPTFVLTYTAMLAATVLVRLERGWTVTTVLVLGMLVAPPLDVFLIPRCLRTFGDGGAGVGAALTLLVVELGTTSLLLAAVGRTAIDRRLVTMVVKSGFAVLVVLVLDTALRTLGVWRFAIDAVAYAALVLGSGAVNAREVVGLFRGAMQRRSATEAAVA